MTGSVQVLSFRIGAIPCLAISDADQGNRNVLLLDVPRHRTLLDCGAGRSYEPNPGRLLDALGEAGISPASIRNVILTHADVDHVGGAIEDGRSSFPHARFVLSHPERAFWRGHPERLRPSPAFDAAFVSRVNNVPPAALETLRAQLDPLPFGAEAVSGVRLRAAPGHTPGNCVAEIRSGAATLLFAADLFYEARNLEQAGWVSPYDFDPAQVVATRKDILDQAARRQTPLMLTHMPFPGLGTVEARGATWRWTPWTP